MHDNCQMESWKFEQPFPDQARWRSICGKLIDQPKLPVSRPSQQFDQSDGACWDLAARIVFVLAGSITFANVNLALTFVIALMLTTKHLCINWAQAAARSPLILDTWFTFQPPLGLDLLQFLMRSLPSSLFYQLPFVSVFCSQSPLFSIYISVVAPGPKSEKFPSLSLSRHSLSSP